MRHISVEIHAPCIPRFKCKVVAKVAVCTLVVAHSCLYTNKGFAGIVVEPELQCWYHQAASRRVHSGNGVCNQQEDTPTNRLLRIVHNDEAVPNKPG